jgi:hypothetical protein
MPFIVLDLRFLNLVSCVALFTADTLGQDDVATARGLPFSFPGLKREKREPEAR